MIYLPQERDLRGLVPAYRIIIEERNGPVWSFLPMSYQLRVESGLDQGKVFTLNVGDGLMLGRSAQAQYQLNDPRASRNHCQILLRDGQVEVICGGGSGGTLVNGKKVDRSRLEPGDLLEIGETKMRLEVGDLPLDVAIAQSIGAKQDPGSPRPDPSLKAELAGLLGMQLSHYQINTLIGSGLTSVVFHATDLKDNRSVALKVLHPDFATDEDEMQRFIRSIKTVLPLRNPHLITLLAAGKTGPHCWMAMDYIAGENLTEVIKRIGIAGMLDWKHAFRVALQISRALEYAHGQGIVHRNVTPTNILIEAASKMVKLGDLMLAKALEGPLAKHITRQGEIVGDVAYMSPERTRGMMELDHRSDLYSLGATVYALLTGRPPFQGNSLVEKITRIRQTEPEKPRKFQMSIPGQFEGIVLKCLAKVPENRFASATEMLRELERVGRFNGAPLD